MNGRESDRSFSKRIGVSHRSIKLYRDGQVPDIITLRRIASNLGLSEKGFMELVYAAEGKDISQSRDVPVYDIQSVTYQNSKFIGKPVDHLSCLMFHKPQSVVSAAYRAIKVDSSNPFCGDSTPGTDTIFVFNQNRVELQPNAVCVFVGSDDRLFIGRVIVRGRQIWLSKGNDDAAEKVSLSTFDESILGQIFLKIVSFRNGV